jgi:outer membrane lipopolysaccharide assembly protein LptE/RlpB
MNYLITFLFLVLLIGGLTACTFENTRQSVGVATNPFSTKMEEKTKLQWKITFGKIRPKEDTDD